MTNHSWVLDAFFDDSLICQVLLQLRQQLSQPPPPPPIPQPPEIFTDWAVRHRRSRRMQVRPAVAARSEVIGTCRNRSNASKSKAILPEPSGERMHVKKPGKLKKFRRLVRLADKEAMLEEKGQRKREHEITKTAIKNVNDNESPIKSNKLKRLVRLVDKEAMFEEKRQQKREHGITKTAIKNVDNDKDSLVKSNMKPRTHKVKDETVVPFRFADNTQLKCLDTLLFK